MFIFLKSVLLKYYENRSVWGHTFITYRTIGHNQYMFCSTFLKNKVVEQSEESKVVLACATPVLWRHMALDSSLALLLTRGNVIYEKLYWPWSQLNLGTHYSLSHTPVALDKFLNLSVSPFCKILKSDTNIYPAGSLWTPLIMYIQYPL